MFLEICSVLVLPISIFSTIEGSITPIRRFKHRILGEQLLSSANAIYSTEYWFTQRLDHFQPTDERTWNQRYFLREDFYKPGGPVFLMIEGEGEADINWITSAAWVGYAKKYNALMFVLEHRYYGKSQPASDLSVENLKYLSSEQALADLAYFIVGMNSQHKLPPTTKWIAFGGSYAGNLAAWVRYKYPHLIYASVSSSGPVLAKVDFPEYLDVVKTSLATHSRQCVESIETANKEINQLLKTPVGRRTIEEMFRLCNPIDIMNQNDVVSLLQTLWEVVEGSAQRDKQFGVTWDIKSVCDVMVNQSLGAPIKRLAALAKPNECLHYTYYEHVEYYKDISFDKWMGETGDRQWLYQTCTEFGFYQTSESKDALFGEDFPLDYSIQLCSDVFGKGFTKELQYRAVARSNFIYGGMDLKATRVVYVHGSIDPWHALGITKTRIPQSPAIYIEGASHCADMNEYPEGGSPAITAAQEKISTLIGEWLQEPCHDLNILSLKFWNLSNLRCIFSF